MDYLLDESKALEDEEIANGFQYYKVNEFLIQK
jgi:hypothetical protein